MGQVPYGNPGGFTPYQPDATPDGEPAEEGASAPYVPYGNAVPGASVGTPYATPIPAKNRRWPWGIAIAVIVTTLGSCISGLVGIIGSLDGSDSATGSPQAVTEVYANDLVVGQCLNGAGLKPGTPEPVSALRVVECSTAHDAEVLAVKVLDSEAAANYDIDDDSQIDVSCRNLFSESQKEILHAGDFFIWALTETAEPVTGDQVACLVVDGEGGPLRGAFDMAPAQPEAPVQPS